MISYYIAVLLWQQVGVFAFFLNFLDQFVNSATSSSKQTLVWITNSDVCHIGCAVWVELPDIMTYNNTHFTNITLNLREKCEKLELVGSAG